MVMGVVNVTPDSFFPASRTSLHDQAIERGLAHFRDGADVVDVGGESTRPGATPVDGAEELRRVLPVISALARRRGRSRSTPRKRRSPGRPWPRGPRS